VSIASGQVIGNYRVLQQIGTGGMGAVYLAEHPQIGKKVALKVIHKELAHNREVVGRFFNEARSVNRIGNEHIVEVHDFGQSPDGYNYFIMEYLEGRTLAPVLTAERYLSVQRGLHVAAQIADALGAAHTAGIIHRDLKPDNIMLVMRLGDPDFVKILDFGLAKMFADGMMSNLTAVGVVLGTPQYMSPEACESKRDVDHRTDIYAVGILLFQMLCGQLPFDGQSMGEVLVKQVMHAPPAPRGINPHIPPSVEQIILRCLTKAPDARFPTMMALRDALLDPDRYLASSPPVVPAALAAAAPGARTIFDAGPMPSMTGMAAAPLGYAQTAAVPALGPDAGRATGPQMALRAPPPSIMTDARDARTMFDPGGQVPPAAPPPRGPSGQVHAQAAATAIMEGGFDAAAVAATRRSTAMPGMQQPIVAENRTMVIGTPQGYKDRPPRRSWPIVVMMVLLAGAIGGGIAIVMMNKKSEARAGAGSGSASAQVASGSDQAVDAGSAQVDQVAVAPDAAPAKPLPLAAPDAAPVASVAPDAGSGSGSATVSAILVKVRIESDPSEAEVWIDGKQLGKTPTDVEMAPDGADHELVLRHPTRKEKKKTIQVTSATTIRLELERGSSKGAGSSKGSGSRKGSGKGTAKGSSSSDGEDDTMKPPWMK